MEIPIQLRLDVMMASIDGALAVDKPTPRIQLLILSTLVRELTARMDQISAGLDNPQ